MKKYYIGIRRYFLNGTINYVPRCIHLLEENYSPFIGTYSECKMMINKLTKLYILSHGEYSSPDFFIIGVNSIRGIKLFNKYYRGKL